MKPRVIVTRAEPGASLTAGELAKRGVDPILAPIFRIEATGGVPPDPAAFQALLFTSANAVRSFSASPAWLTKTAFCVGAATAAAAQSVGFVRCPHANGDSHALLALVRAQLLPADGRLLHVRGVDVAGDLFGQLGGLGFSTDLLITYRSVAARTLPAAAVTALQDDAPCPLAVLFHSPRGAELGASLLRADAGRLHAAFISEAAARAGAAAAWASVGIAEQPSDKALIATALTQIAACT
jgi:uroporphyrinogen-III synthase